MQELVQTIVSMVGGDAVRELTSKVGLDPQMAERAVPSAVEVITGQLGGVAKGGLGGLVEGGMDMLGGLLGGGAPKLPDPEGAVRSLSSALGLDSGTASGILETLLPLVMKVLQSGGEEGGLGSMLGSLGKMF